VVSAGSPPVVTEESKMMQKRRTQQGMMPYQQPLAEFTEWEVGSNYECEKIIGVGSYGSVCRAT
jgi:hypothetical protein